MFTPLPKPAVVQQFLRRLKLPRSAVLPFTKVDQRYTYHHCHTNAAHRAREAGGKVVPGWIVWHRSFAEVEHHAVWQPPGTTDLVDVTPRSDGEKKICFLPDPGRRIGPSPVPEADVLLWANKLLGDHDLPTVFRRQPSPERVLVQFDAGSRVLMEQLAISVAEVVEIGGRGRWPSPKSGWMVMTSASSRAAR